MGWIVDTYRMLFGQSDVNAWACVTGPSITEVACSHLHTDLSPSKREMTECLRSPGKPISMGGIDGRTEATGLGLVYATRAFLSKRDECKRFGIAPGMHGKTVIVQGFGNVGFHAARFMQQEGCKVVGVVERDAAVYNSAGLDVMALKDYYKSKGTILGFDGAERQLESQPHALMEEACDILVPAAMERSIHKGNAHRIQAKMICEGANGPTTPAAEAILDAKGVVILPDILTNSGGVSVSYFEWLKNLAHVGFGKLTRRWEERGKQGLLAELKLAGIDTSDSKESALSKGATEKDLVYSGLEDTICTGLDEVPIHTRHVHYGARGG